jgi:hypothetical protein
MNTVEKVARAISETRDLCWDQYSPELKATYKAMARAAIAAMREPSEAMVEAAGCAPVKSYAWQDGVKASWEAMLDAALAEEPK